MLCLFYMLVCLSVCLLCLYVLSVPFIGSLYLSVCSIRLFDIYILSVCSFCLFCLSVCSVCSLCLSVCSISPFVISILNMFYLSVLSVSLSVSQSVHRSCKYSLQFNIQLFRRPLHSLFIWLSFSYLETAICCPRILLPWCRLHASPIALSGGCFWSRCRLVKHLSFICGSQQQPQ